MTTLIIVGVIVLLVILTIVGLLSRYRKCPSDQLLVVFGKVGGKSAAKIYPGGGVFVWPVIQDYKVMSSYGHIRDLKKKEISIDLKTLEPENETIPD